ncbi:MAG TPA: prenyltransferase/squalene oxidase repeat-containing protein, partial [Ktedonobacterales bacterium]
MALEQEEQITTPPLVIQISDKSVAVKAAITRTQDYLLRAQSPEGWWWGELESNVTITAEYLFLTHFLGVADTERWVKIAAYIRDQQRPDGAWGIYYDAPGDLSTTLEAYFALKMAGISPETPFMQQARAFILAQGGILKVRIFTKIWLALLGQYDWRGLPVMPPELIFLPSWFPFNIYDFSCWARGTIVPILILLTERPSRPARASADVSELFCRPEDRYDWRLPDRGPTPLFSWRRFFIGADKALRRLEQTRWKPLRRVAKRSCEDWIVAHQEADGSWGGIQPPWVYSLLALHVLGRPASDPVIAKGLHGFEDFAIEDERTFRTQSCMSPVWDTCLTATALLDSGLPPDHPALLKTGRWLIGEQIFAGGDWQIKQRGWRMRPQMEITNKGTGMPHPTPANKFASKGVPPPNLPTQVPPTLSDQALQSSVDDRINRPSAEAGSPRRWTWWLQALRREFIRQPGRPGGWAFEFQNDWYPDTDDTSEVLLALRRIAFPPEDTRAQAIALERGTEWLLSMQSKNGGFASFDVDNTRQAITQIPFCDFGEVIDPPSEDVTAHILEWFGTMGMPKDHPQLQAALRYLKRKQYADGSWWGRWGVNYIYGVGAVLPALRALGEDMRQPYIQRAAQWLLKCQQDDGGWGETCASYDNPRLRGTGAATASQTAWALLGLLVVKQGGSANRSINQ